jgi:CPA1 family monovalent cation:H+ antiporter
VAAGLYLGHRSPRLQTAATRLQGTEVWREIEFLLESVVFALIGLQLPTVLDQLTEGSTGSVVVASVVALTVTIASRFAWMYPATYLPRMLPKVAAHDPPPPRTYPTVLAWAGMRGSWRPRSTLPADFRAQPHPVPPFVVVLGPHC